MMTASEPVRQVCAPGIEARRALVDQIRAAQAHDPFAPVTVIVPSRRSALSLRRDLGGVDPSLGDRGLVNVRFEVATRLLELLGVAALPPGKRLTDVVLREQVRTALASDPRHFGLAAVHPTTIERAATGYRELRALGSAGRTALAAAGRRGHALAGLYQRVDQALAGWHDDADLLAAAVDAIHRDTPAVQELGAVVCFAPDPADPVSAALIGAFGERATVIELDEPTPAELAADAQVLSVSDPDEEARVAARTILELAEAGTPLHRIAVAHPNRRYAVLLHQHLERAGIPHHGPSVRDLAHTPGGVALLGLLEIAATDLSRDSVTRWLASAPIADPVDGRPPVSLWDRESRRAGVIAGIEQWRSRLERHRIESGHDAISALEAFVERLHDTVEGAVTQPWSAWGTWARTALETYVGRPSRHRNWPDHEIDALEQLFAAIDALTVLDEIAADPDLAMFTEVLTMELEAPVGRIGTFGDGVYVGPIRSVGALCVDAVIVVGAAEGLVPHRPPVDPLLGDTERAKAGLPEPGGSVAEQRRHFHVALGAATSRVVLAPRGDLRANHSYLPSRWLAELAPAVELRSFADSLSRTTTPTDTVERRLAQLCPDYHDHPLPLDTPAVAADPLVAAGFRAAIARGTGGFTEFDGRIEPDPAVLLSTERPLSPTSLQTYAICPRQYLFAKVFRLDPTERPEEITELSPLERGTLVHEILERWVADRIAGVPGAADLAHLLEIADTCFAEVEAQGITGRPLPWRHRQDVIRRELLQIAALDREAGTPVGVEPLAVELTFGRDGADPVIIDLPTQGRVAFAGSVDRVGRMADGSLVVADYKTGSSRHFAKIDKTVVNNGELLQLPLYALAARQRFGTPTTPVSAWYWFITELENFTAKGYELTDEHVNVFTTTLDAIVGGIRAGHFPGRPGEFDHFRKAGANCAWCSFRHICPTGREEQWERSATDPALATYVALTNGELTAPVGADASTNGKARS